METAVSTSEPHIDKMKEAKEVAMGMRPVGYWRHPGCHKNVNYDSIYTELRVSDYEKALRAEETAAAAHFAEQFHRRYSSKGPIFSPGTLEDTILTAKDSTQKNSDRQRMVGLYLHHEDARHTHTFCSQVLTHHTVATFLDDNYLLWGWDLKHHSHTKNIRSSVINFLGIVLTERMVALGMEQLPILVTIVRARYGWEILSLVQGNCSASELVTCLEATRELHAAQTVITRQRDEKEEVGSHGLVKQLVQLEGSPRKGPDIPAWAIPLTPEYLEKLMALRHHLYKQREEQERRERDWKKVISTAIKDGMDVAAIREIVAKENGDLKVWVPSPDLPETTCCLLTLAAWEGHTSLLPLLLAAGLSVDGGGTTFNTPLMAAASRGHAGMVEALLSRAAQCSAKDDRRGTTALHLAAYHGHEACVALLIPHTLAAYHNNPDAITDNDGVTLVHAASFIGHWEVIEQLKAAGWSLHTLDKYGNTPLHLAARSGSVRVVQSLVAAGLNPNLKNNSNETPLSRAVQHGNHQVESWILKHQRSGRFMRPATPANTLQCMRTQMYDNRTMHGRYKICIRNHQSIETLKFLLQVNDPHLVDDHGLTVLHMMADDAYIVCPAMLSDVFGHHHALTHDGCTPVDLARRGSTVSDSHKKILRVLESHQCPKVAGSPEELYLKLLTVITRGDDAKEVSRLLCAGTPMELTGDFPGSALQQAVTNDRASIVTLLLAAGASITPSTQGLSLLHQAWYSPNTTPKVYAALTLAFSGQLKRERDRLPRSRTKGLRDDLAQLIATIDGDTPWEAAWPLEMTIRGKTERRTVTKLTDFIITAARSNCPLSVSFLRWAGAWPFSNGGKGATALHGAIKAGHLALVEVMVRDLGASLYIPDTTQGLPRDMEQMPPDLLRRLELLMYRRERWQLETLALQQKDTSEKEKVEAVVAVQEALFHRYTGQAAAAGDVTRGAAGDALLIASRVGLLQLLYLVLSVAQLPPDTVVDVICGTTALHEAAAHGMSGCVTHLLLALQAAATANASNVAAIAAAAAPTTTTGAHNTQLHRYSPLQPDRYSQTALHLAAMFGHKHTLELLLQYVGQDTPCRAGTDAKQVHENFIGYLRRYRRYTDDKNEAPSPRDHCDATVTLKRLLSATDIARLPSEARRANVDFSEESEDRRVRDAVVRAAGILLGQAASATTAYMGGRQLKVRLVGSGRDGSKMFSPDEFDINVVVAAGECVSVEVQQETESSRNYKGHALRIDVDTRHPHLHGERLAEDLYGAVSEALTDCVLDERRLSVVPPGLTKTQVGVALALAWQGEQYPLLLVGVDLVPVLEVPWHASIARPALTPPGASTMHLSAASDGSWRCSFAQLEAEVLAGLSPEERIVQLSAKLLLSSLKAERWMPWRIKALSTWWCGQSWNVPVPGGFCLKTAIFLVLEDKRKAGAQWRESDTILRVTQVFERMCSPEDTCVPGGQSETLLPQRMKAYFGGECEGTKDATSAPLIASHLRRFLRRHQCGTFSLGSVARWWWWRLAGVWRPVVRRMLYRTPTPHATPATKQHLRDDATHPKRLPKSHVL